jgi:Peptidase C13 family
MQELEAATEAHTDAHTDLRIEYVVSRDDYRAAQHGVAQQLLRSIQWSPMVYALAAATVACGIVIGMGYIELTNGYIGRQWRWKWFLAVALLVIWLLTIWQQRLRAAHVYAASAPDDSIMLGPQALTLTREALIHEGRGVITQMTWAALKCVVRRHDALLIILNNYTFFCLPDRAFSSEPQRDLWLATLQEHAPQVIVGEPIQAVRPEAMQAVQVVAPAKIGLRENWRAGARLAFFRRVQPGDMVCTAEAFIVLVGLSLLLLTLSGVAYAGLHGQFNHYELPRALLFVPLVLLFGVVAGRATADRMPLLMLPVALAAASLVISLVSVIAGHLMYHQVIAVAAKHWKGLFYFQLLWWSAVIVFASWRLMPSPPRRIAGMAVLGLALLVAPALWFPRHQLWIPAEDAKARSVVNENYYALADEKGFHAQQNLLQRALAALQPQRPGVVDVYALTAGLYASEDVFMKEVKLIDTLLRKRFDADGRSLMLINNPKTVHETPLASATSLSAALKHIGGLMNVEEDVLVLYVSSHGSQQHELSVDFWPLRLQPITPPVLKKALDESRIQWKVLVVSACYSGGFIEPLKDERTLIITASSATKTSFGCGHESDATYLAKALFDEALRKIYSFEAAFDSAREAIRAREQAQGHEPSEPQIFVGAAIREKLLQVEKRLSGLNP